MVFPYFPTTNGCCQNHDNPVKDHPELGGNNRGQISDGYGTDVLEGDMDHGTAVALAMMGRPSGSFLGGISPAATFYWTDRGSRQNYRLCSRCVLVLASTR